MALKSFGKITVATAGTPVRCTINESVPATRFGVQSISVYGPAGNTGNIYLGTATMNRSTFAGVYAIIPKGTWASGVINLAPAGINANELYIDADNSNDTALVVGTEQ